MIDVRHPILVVPALLLTACDGGVDCTLIGCASSLTLHVTGAGDAIGLSGSVTVADHTFVVDCLGESDPEVSCEGATVTIQLSESIPGGGDVTWALTVDGGDTGGGGGGYAGSGTFAPDWTESTPNGPDCGPTCWAGEGTVELLGTP